MQTSSLGWTLLRPGGFDSNAMAWAQSIRTDGVVRSPYGDASLPTINPADIAAVAAAILRSSDHDGEIYDLTGPSLISPRAQTAVLAEVLGRPLEFIEQTAAEAKAQMLELISEPIATGTLTVQAESAVTPPPISPHVERILGRRGRTFAEWATANAAAFG